MQAGGVLVLGVGVAGWPMLRGSHWSSFVPMRVLYWSAEINDDRSFFLGSALSNAGMSPVVTGAGTTRWDWARDAHSINSQLLADLRTGALDGKAGAPTKSGMWMTLLMVRADAWGGEWPSAYLHSPAVCLAIQRPALNDSLRVRLMYFLSQRGRRDAREAQAVGVWLGDDEVGANAAATLLFLRRDEQLAVATFKQLLESPDAEKRLGALRAVFRGSGMNISDRVPSGRLVEVVRVALGDPEVKVRREGAYIASEIVERAWARVQSGKGTPGWIRDMLVDLVPILESAHEGEEDYGTIVALSFTISNIEKMLDEGE